LARKLIKAGRHVIGDRDAWSEHRPSRSAQKRFIEEHGLREFGKGHLGEEDEPAAESRAGQYKHIEIELAAARLHGMQEEFNA
jgi:hypothetical protein